MTDRRVPAWLYASFLLTALLAGYSMFLRFQVESRNKAVAIVAEGDTVATLAATKRISLEQALGQLKAAGLTGVVLPEEFISDLVSDGKLAVAPQVVRITNDDGEIRSRVSRGLTNRFGIFVPPGGVDIPIDTLAPGLARSTSVGLDPRIAQAARAQDLIVVARIGNPQGATEAYVKSSISWASELGATVFLPQGEQVLGRRDSLGALSEALSASKMLYATPEFAKIGGDANVVAKSPELVVRLHAAQSAELDKLGLPEAVERYGKAAAERNQRVLLVRPLTNAASDPLDSFGEFVTLVKKQIEREGYTLAAPHPFSDSNVPVWLFVAIALSVMPVVAWLASSMPVSRSVAFGIVGIAGLLALASALPQGRSYFALAAALAYPCAAFLLLEKSPVGIVIGYIRTTAISLLGGMCVAGLLNGLPFFVKADAFDGVKIAHFLPVALIGFYFLSRTTNLREAMKTPIFWQQAALGLALLLGFAFMAARTGNDNPAGVSGLELKFRALLDQVLYVRPRTKEFLVGHPALIVALGMLASKRNYGGWTVIAIMLAVIGQTSVVNTMCHLHTPLTLSLARIGVGWIVGGILGAMVWGVLSRFSARRAS